MNKYSKTITINGKKYKVEHIDDVEYVDGKTIDEFNDALAISDREGLLDLVKLASTLVKYGKIGSPQKKINTFFQSRNN